MAVEWTLFQPCGRKNLVERGYKFLASKKILINVEILIYSRIMTSQMNENNCAESKNSDLS